MNLLDWDKLYIKKVHVPAPNNIMFKILPIILSHTSQKYYQLYSHIITDYSRIIPISFFSNITIGSRLNTSKITQQM